MTRLLSLAITSLLFIACGNDGVGNNGGLVGGSCTSAADCEFRCETGGDLPGGTCTVACNVDDDCPGGTF